MDLDSLLRGQVGWRTVTGPGAIGRVVSAATNMASGQHAQADADDLKI